MYPSYGVMQTNQKYGQNGDIDAENSGTYYNPNDDTMTDYKWNGYQGAAYVDEVPGSRRQNNSNYQGYNVAQQMAKGNGKFVNGRWQ